MVGDLELIKSLSESTISNFQGSLWLAYHMEYRCGHGSFSFSLHFKNKCKLEAETKELALKTNSIQQIVLQKKIDNSSKY